MFESMQFKRSFRNRERNNISEFTNGICVRMNIGIKFGVGELEKVRMQLCRKIYSKQVFLKGGGMALLLQNTEE